MVRKGKAGKGIGGKGRGGEGTGRAGERRESDRKKTASSLHLYCIVCFRFLPRDAYA